MKFNPLRKYLQAWKFRRAQRLQVLACRHYLLEKGLTPDEINDYLSRR